MGSEMEPINSRREVATAVVLVVFSVVYFISGFRLDRGTIQDPGPGFLPVAIGFLLILCTGIYLVGVLRRKLHSGKPAGAAATERKNYRAIFGILFCALLYPLILQRLKFIISTLIVAFFMLVLLQPKKPFFSFSLALAMAVGTYVVFSFLLGVALPMGFLENLLFRIGG
jgi:hypothetical protein